MKTVGKIVKFSGGISSSLKEGLEASYAFGRSIDIRSDAKQISILPKAQKESGSLVTDLVMWGERIGTNLYFYGDSGNIYLRTSSAVWSLAHTAAGSSGNGLAYFGEDDYLYYPQNTTIGRYGQTGATTPEWYDDFLGSEGGDPTNTHSAVMEADSSQYFTRADTASLSITGDITLEIYAKPESLPTTTDVMTLMSKWDLNNNDRSYKLDITPTSGQFGDGGDGALTIAASATRTEIDSSCSGTVDTYALTATNTSFAADQKVMIHQTRGTNSGVYQITTIESYTAGTITTTDPLVISYNSTGDNKAQVLVMKEYTTATINASKVYTVKAWTGTVGGIMAFYADDTTTVNGTISGAGGNGTARNTGGDGTGGGTGGGFRGGGTDDTDNPGANGYSGEGTGGASEHTNVDTTDNLYPNGTYNVGNWPNGNGGGGGPRGGPGAGGGNGMVGTSVWPYDAWAYGGLSSGSAGLSIATFGGGGGGGSGNWLKNGGGGSGGGIVIIISKTITMGAAGYISVAGGRGGNADLNHSGGGSGAGGSMLLRADVATLGTSRLLAYGGKHSQTGSGEREGGNGGDGRIHLDYYTSYTGTTYYAIEDAGDNPAIDVDQDDSLAGGGDGYVLRFHVSTNGTASESYQWEITEDIAVDTWTRWQVAWDASASTAYFYKNGNLLGQRVGALTAIDNNASAFAVGCEFDAASDDANHFDGKVDDVRVWNDIRTATELKRYNDFVLYGTEPGLIAYWKFDNDATDSQTSGLNDLTATNSPTYDISDVPFSGVTARADLDQSLDTSGNTYTLAAAITEAATAIQSFTPAKDPQKSVEVNIAATGTGNWTVTVHDSLNREIAAVTVALAQLHTGDYEFEFASVWRPVIGDEYHFHVTSTVADGTVVTTDNADLETADYHTYFQFLVSDKYHPAVQFLNFLAIGNERYVSKLEGGNVYTPHAITLPSGYRVRCLAFWREYLAIGTWKGTNIYDYDAGRIFFWDGTASTYNFYIDVPEGGINTMKGTKGLLYVVAGYSGDTLIYQGGDAAQKVKRIPKMARDKYVEVHPGGMDMWKTLVRIGVAGLTDSSAIEQGVYSYGSTNRLYPESLSYDYPLSIDVRKDTDVKIGMVKASGQDLFISWRNNTTYGVDRVNVSNSPYATATYEALITDLGDIPKKKYPLVLRADFEPLKTSETIQTKYKADRDQEWNLGTKQTTLSSQATRQIIKEQVNEIQVAVDLGSTGSTSPILTGLSLESEDEKKGRNA